MIKKFSLLLLASILSVLVPLATSASANVNDFQISNYDISYHLGRDDSGRSILRVTETIVAQFPNTDQNRGVERYVPKSYDEHPVDLQISSVTDGQQVGRNFTTYDSGDYTVVRIGDTDRYVYGEQTYVLNYVHRDVTKAFADVGLDEFYWDTNGTVWRVPIGQLNVSLTIDESIADALTGAASCYVGQFNSSNRCELVENGPNYSASVGPLAPGENLSLAVAFRPETFAAYQQSLLEKVASVWAIVQAGLMVVAVGLISWLAARFSSLTRRKKEVGTIIPEYLPPKDSSIEMSATLLASARPSFAAQLIDLAVRHYLKIYEVKEKSFMSAAVYEIEVVKPTDDLRAEEKEFLSDIFAGKATVGAKIDTKAMKNDYLLGARLMDNPAKIQKLKRGKYGIEEKNPTAAKWFRVFSVVTLVFGLILLSPPILFASLVSFIMSYAMWSLTDEGLALYRYLKGLKMYISVAEEERLRMLQSPEGVSKVHVDTADPKKLVKLYERVLPYAILFGQEKEWNKHIGNYYASAGESPSWYHGASLGAFNAAAFSSSLSNMTTSISSSGASYSSSSGSSGGGFSGGGGGGGGGGGW